MWTQNGHILPFLKSVSLKERKKKVLKSNKKKFLWGVPCETIATKVNCYSLLLV